MNSSRRKFLNNGLRLSAGAGLVSFPLLRGMGMNTIVSSLESLKIGLIGANSMGWANLREHIKIPGVECIALADIDQNVLARRASELETLTKKKPILYQDFRKLLENKDVDAVIIGTPDHWHCLQTVYACEMGKDVYVEKPLAKTIDECNVMLAAASRYKRVVQVGQWQRSGLHWKSAIDFVQSGKLGKIRHVKNWLYYGNSNILQPVADSNAPQGVDYDMWLGPAPKRAFNQNRFHGSWRYFWDYGGGIMTDWGVHLLDMAFFGMKSTYPKTVISAGGNYAVPGNLMETPDNQFATYSFDNYAVTWEHVIGATPGLYGNNYCGVAFIGENGTLVVDREKWRLFPESSSGKYKMEAMPEQRGTGGDLSAHVENFVSCIKSRNKPACDIETARNVAVNSILGNLAFRLNRPLQWDNANNRFVNDKEADSFIRPIYRQPWTFPKA